MQIKKETFIGYQNQGIIPKEYRIDNPEDNLKAGKLILEDLYKKYGGDIEKVAAAYYGGPKVIGKDGTIDLSVKPIRTNPATGKPYDENDPKRPKDPTVGEYIDQIKKRIAGEPVVKPVSNRPKTILELQSEKELKGERAKLTMQNDVKRTEEFEKTTNIDELSRHRAVANKAMKILSKNPSVAGTLRNDTGAIAAIQQFIAGSMKRVDFEDIMNTALAKTVADSNERRELIGYLAENEIRNRGMVKGTGAISDYEQQILSRIAGNISDPAEVLYKRFRVFDKTNEYNIAIRQLWNDNKKQFGSFSEFENSKDYRKLLKAYQDDLDNVIYEESDFSAARKEKAASGKGGQGNVNRPPDIQEIIKRNQANK
jgi:Ca2+-binding EF-hand superfamily protein